jgi:adenylate kinase
VYVWSDPDQISEWRRTDTSRRREVESVDDIARHQDIALETTFRLAERLGSRMRTIYNSRGEIISAVSTISQEVDELKI